MSRPEMHPQKYRELLSRRGESVRWWRASRCPCYNKQGGYQDTKCPLCGGKAVIYSEQLNISGYRAGMRGVSEHKEFLAQGVLLAGDVQITSMPDELAFGEGDIILLPTRRLRYSESMLRGTSDRERLKHWASDIVEVRDLSKTYTVGEDVQVLVGGLDDYWLLWKEGGKSLETGTNYSVIYHHYPLYVVLPDVGVARRVIEGVPLPQRVFARVKNTETLGC